MDFDRTAEYAHHHSEEEGRKTRKMIWVVFWILLAVTTVEVTLGLFHKDIGIPWDLVKWTFIIMTLIKGYYIVAFYMHLKNEFLNFKLIISIPYLVLGTYFVILLIIEGIYLYNTDHLLQ